MEAVYLPFFCFVLQLTTGGKCVKDGRFVSEHSG